MLLCHASNDNSLASLVWLQCIHAEEMPCVMLEGSDGKLLLAKREFKECSQILTDYSDLGKGIKWGLDTLTLVLMTLTVVGTWFCFVSLFLKSIKIMKWKKLMSIMTVDSILLHPRTLV